MEGNETLNFGKFAGKTMEEVCHDHPSYQNWCQTTAAESDNSSWRLRRFACYVTQYKAKTAIGTRVPVAEHQPPSGDAQGRESGWLHQEYEVLPFQISGTRSQASDTSYSLVGSASSKTSWRDETTEVAELKAQLAKLQEEKDEMEMTLARTKGWKEM